MRKISILTCSVVVLLGVVNMAAARDVSGSATPTNCTTTISNCATIATASALSTCFGTEFPANAVVIMGCSTADDTTITCVTNTDTANLRCMQATDGATPTFPSYTVADTGASVCGGGNAVQAVRWTQNTCTNAPSF